MSASAKRTEELTGDLVTIPRHVVNYDVTETQIAELREKFAGLSVIDPKLYEPRRKAIGTLRELRVAVEKKRKELKADSLEYGRKVDAVAKHFTGLLEEIELPLQAAKDSIDRETERLKREKEEAERGRVAAEERAKLEAEAAELKRIRDAEQAEIDRQKAELEAERAKLAKEREEHEAIERAEQAKRDEVARVERERVAAEHEAERKRLAKIAAEQAEAQRQLDEQRAVVRRQQEANERAELERVTRERTERETCERLERERLEAEAAAKAKAERDAAEAARLEALRPDFEKVRAFAAAVRALPLPDVESDDARCALADARTSLVAVALDLEAFSGAL